MARKKIPRTLSSLPARAHVQKASHKTERLTEVLRHAAITNQRAQPRPFYSLREISAHFAVPYALAARAYEQLQREGLLTAVRGSRTVLEGQQFDRQISVRAFVGLPASLSAFVTIQAYRMFFITIRRELRVRGFATAMVFYEKQEARTAALSERLKSYQLDTVIWFQPPKEARETAARLKDLGLRLLGVAHERAPAFPCRYDVRRDRAIGTLLSNWKSPLGIDHVTVAQWPKHGAPLLEEALHSTLAELGLRATVANFSGKGSAKFLRSVGRAKTGGIVFSSSELASRLSFRAPTTMEDLLCRRRVAFLNGPVTMPFAHVPSAQVDLVIADWQWIAEQIANDLVSQNAFSLPGPTIFEAEAKLRVSLTDFAQVI